MQQERVIFIIEICNNNNNNNYNILEKMIKENALGSEYVRIPANIISS
jgi:hypothetical protein